MLLSLALAGALATTQNNASQVVKRGEMTYDSQPMHVHTEGVPDPLDPSRTVQAQVSYFVQFRIHMEDEPDDYEVSRTVRVRPEQPAQTFQMFQQRRGIENNSGNRRDMRAFAETLRNEMIPVSNAGILNRALQAMRSISVEDVSKLPITVDPNEDLRSGGWTVREYGYDLWYTDLHMQLYKSVLLPGKTEPTVTPVGEEQIFDLYEYAIPVPKIRERFIPDPATGQTSNSSLPEGFGGVEFTDEFKNLTGAPYITIPRLKLGYNIYGGTGLSTNATKYMDDVFSTIPRDRNDVFNIIKLSPNQVTGMLNGAAGQGDSMNALNVPGDLREFGEPRCGSGMDMPPGTIWIPDKPGYQTMTNTTRLQLRFNFEAGIEGGYKNFDTIRMHCLNKDLHEPAPGVRYFPYMTNDETLQSLAEIASKSNFRGPWDQARTWIYTDKASFDQINQRILPPISEGQYGNGLFDVLKVGGLSPADLKNKKFFDPKLLGSAGLLDKAFDWLSMQAGEIAGKEVRKWIEGMPENVQKMLKSPASDFEKKHVPRLFKSLLASLNPDVRKGALNYLDKNKDAEAPLKDQLGDFRASLFSDDAEEAALAQKVAPRYLTDLAPDLRWQLKQ